MSWRERLGVSAHHFLHSFLIFEQLVLDKKTQKSTLTFCYSWIKSRSAGTTSTSPLPLGGVGSARDTSPGRHPEQMPEPPPANVLSIPRQTSGPRPNINVRRARTGRFSRPPGLGGSKTSPISGVSVTANQSKMVTFNAEDQSQMLAFFPG